MAESSTQDRTESATTRRREESRERGQVAISHDMNQAVLLLTALGLLWYFGPQMGDSLQASLRRDLLTLPHDNWSIPHTVLMTRQVLSRAVEIVFPITLVMALCAFGVNALQVGLRVSWEPLAPNWGKLDLVQGFTKLFSIRSATRGIMMLLKMSLGLGIAAWFLYRNRQDVHDLGISGLSRAIQQTWRFSLLTCFCLAGMLLAIGLADYLYQRWQHEQDLMMSKQEIKEENKREDGDPLMKGRMRRFARESIKQQMLKKIPEATVILTNPTHIAVAIKYDRDTMLAPRVIAKGTDLFAKRIAKIARENGIPVLERKPLARALYASVDVDQEIPANLYRAMAEILAYIYGLKDAA